MKQKNSYQFVFLCILFFTSITYAQQHKVNPKLLIGHWKLDLTPGDTTDNNFAQMKISQVSKNTFTGSFYNADTPIKKGTISTQADLLYGALVSGDNSGIYNTSFYYEKGTLYGSTHSLGRNFLSVWTATKTKP